MTEQKIKFGGKKIKEMQEQYMTAVSDLYDALREYETETDYLLGTWKGNAADTFSAANRRSCEQLDESMQRTEKLMLALIQTERVFGEGEKEILNTMERVPAWGM
ncbi:MAG: hypothetical protein J6J79_02920 [Lachnospiraceae bacterium]|nr:hypothetical protein [Lachnospiraceae bacterium]